VSCAESATQLNGGFRFNVYQWSQGGKRKLMHTSATSTECAGARIAIAGASPSGGSTTLAVGDRLMIVWEIMNVGTWAGNGSRTITLRTGAASTVFGDTQVTFTETLSFAADTNNSGARRMSASINNAPASGGGGGSFSATDDFELASLGANWTQATFDGASSSMSIVASSDLGVDTGGVETTIFWAGAGTPAVGGFSAIKITDVSFNSAGASIGVEDGTTDDEVACSIFNGTNWGMDVTNAASTSTPTSGTTSLANGNCIGVLRRDATTFACYISTNAGCTSWTQLGTDQTINNIVNPGKPGIHAASNTTGAAIIEAWCAGDGSAMPTSGCPF
jgi:hypothetical protein